jgi:hypothetical protein
MAAHSIRVLELLSCLSLFVFPGAAQTPGTLNTIFNFSSASGWWPQTGVVVGNNGVLYGTVKYPDGAVYALNPPATGRGWTYTVLYAFSGGPSGVGVGPNALTLDGNGVLYGTDAYGGSTSGTCGSSGCRMVYSLTPPPSAGGTWTEATIHTFEGGSSDGAYPGGSLAIDSSGVLYGTTREGGAQYVGAVLLWPRRLCPMEGGWKPYSTVSGASA